MIGSQFSPNIFWDISKIFFQLNENKNEINFILTSALFQSLFDLEIAIEKRQAHKRFIKLLILVRRAITLFDLNFLYISSLFRLYFVPH